MRIRDARRSSLAACRAIAIAALCTFSSHGAYAQSAEFEPDARTDARPCLGFDFRTGRWGHFGEVESDPSGSCPDGWALMSVARPTGALRSGAYIDVHGACCELPRGVLTAERAEALERCPEGYVATGARVVPVGRTDLDYQELQHLLECRRIDDRYVLDSPQPAWEVSVQQPFFSDLGQAIRGAPVGRIAWSRLSAALRYAIGRSGRTRWNHPSCVGWPEGSVLVAKNGKACADFHFSVIRERATGAAVRTLPECDAVTDPLDAEARCVTGGSSPPD